MQAEPGQTILHYRLIEKIGEGGMGEVWRGEDAKLAREIAIKIRAADFEEDPARLAMFETEAKAVAALSHPNIVTIHSIEEAAGRRFITMELVRGTTLNEIIPSDGLPLKQFYRLAIPISDAISAAHERGVTHGDLKPNNVILGEDDTIKILDFGLARFKRPPSAKDPSELTTAPPSLEGRFAGTMAYMSPEQIEGKPVDHRSDIFTLGILFYEMTTGRLPFRGESFAEMLASILKDTPAPLTGLKSELPRHLDRVIRRCLAKAPSRRVQTTLDLRNELQLLQREADPSGIESAPSVAVLPFADLSPEKDQEYFCDGIAEEIINALTRIENLRVASRTSSFRFKRTEMSSRELGDRLGVRNLLEGSVRKAGDKIRISVELVSAADGYQSWAERYDRELKDIFAIQDEIAQHTVEALQVTLSPKERRAIRQVATTNVQAYDYYLRGRDFFFQYRTRGIEFALQMFSKAIELDPSYALAYAGIADCCSYLYMNVEPAARPWHSIPNWPRPRPPAGSRCRWMGGTMRPSSRSKPPSGSIQSCSTPITSMPVIAIRMEIRKRRSASTSRPPPSAPTITSPSCSSGRSTRISAAKRNRERRAYGASRPRRSVWTSTPTTSAPST